MLSLQKSNYFRKASKGFTLIELLIVIIIISVLASIALPTFLRQRDKARQSEGISKVAAYAKLQILRYAEFDNFVDQNANYYLLGADADRNTSNYSYDFLAISGAGGEKAGVINRATPQRDLRAFASVVGRVFRGNQGSKVTLTTYCQSKSVQKGLELDLGDIDFIEGSPETGGGKIGCKARAVRYGD